MLILHLVCYLSGECSLKKLLLFSSDVFPRVSFLFFACCLFVCFLFCFFKQKEISGH